MCAARKSLRKLRSVGASKNLDKMGVRFRAYACPPIAISSRHDNQRIVSLVNCFGRAAIRVKYVNRFNLLTAEVVVRDTPNVRIECFVNRTFVHKIHYVSFGFFFNMANTD